MSVTVTESALELRTHHDSHVGEHEREPHEVHHEFSLPPADTGKDAWLFLAGAFMIEALVWGFPFSFGIFQSYYSTHEPFAGSKGIAAIGTTASGIMYLSAPLVFTALTQYPQFRQTASILGLVICVIALIGASFAETVNQLIATQGVVYAIGGSLMYSPAILYLDEWFVRRKGLAYGVMWAGTGASGVILPLVINAGLESYDFRTVHRASTVAILVLSSPLLYFVKPRLPLAPASSRRKISIEFLLAPTFWLLQLGNVIQGLGFFLPTIYLPTYASEALHLSPGTGSLLISLLNASSVAGQILLGALSDRVHVTTVILVAVAGSTLSVFLTWGLAVSLPVLVVFSLLYGFFAGGFTSTYAGSCREVIRRHPRTEQGFVFGMFAAGRGIGNVLCGPMSEVLLRSAAGVKSGVGAYGTQFVGLVVVTGCTAAMTGIGWTARRVKND